MKIIGTLETIETGATKEMEFDRADYRHGFGGMRRMLSEGVRLISVRAEREDFEGFTPSFAARIWERLSIRKVSGGLRSG